MKGMKGMNASLVHALLAFSGLVLAYQTWTRVEEDETPVGEVLLADCNAAKLTKLTLKTKALNVSLSPERNNGEVDYWMTVERAEKKATADAGVSEVTEDLKPKRFLTNKKLNEFLALIFPMRAKRNLGAPSAAELKGFGMDQIDSTLTLECGATTTLEVGGSTFGSGDLYARRKGDDNLVLLDGRLLKDLQSAEFNFMQKALHGFVLKDVDEARVTVNGATKRLLQRNRQVTEQATWVDAERPDQRNELYDNWLTRLSRMTAREYLATGAQPGSDVSPAPTADTVVKEIASVEYFVEGIRKGKLTVARAGSDMTHYYARSEATRNWVAVSEVVGQQVERDAAVVVGLEEAATPVTPTSSVTAAPAPSTTEPAPPAEPALPADHPTH